MRGVVILLTVLFSALVTIQGQQYSIKGQVESQDKESLQGVTILLLNSDTLVAGAVSGEKGYFQIDGLPKGEYVAMVSILGYKPYNQKLELASNHRMEPIILEEDAKKLDEIVVNADKRNLIHSGAGLATFHLSTQATQRTNAFEALAEIPQLLVNTTQRTITLTNGETPLILINGVNRPGYIQSLNPSAIESVEIVENPSARYRGDESINGIINIKLKKNKDQAYLNGNFYTKHDPMLEFGVSGLSMESGNKKSSVYMNMQHFYFPHDDQKYESILNSGNQTRQLNGDQYYKSQSFYANLGGDYIASDKDYWAFSTTIITNPSTQEGTLTGFLNQTEINRSSPLHSKTRTDNTYTTVTGNVYYKRSFSQAHTLETTLNYGYASSSAKGYREEISDIHSYTNNVDLYNSKNSLNLKLDYEGQLLDRWTIGGGSQTSMFKMNINDLTQSYTNLPYGSLTEYMYLSIDNNRQQSRFSYMISMGMDLVFNRIDNLSHQYINFTPSASLNYSFNDNSSLQLNYARNRITPTVDKLNPRNTSTDSLIFYIGNPYLTPSMRDRIDLRYTYNHKALYLSPFISYRIYSDNIRSTGMFIDNIYVNSYTNKGTMNIVEAGLSSRINLGKYGNINLSLFGQKNYMNESAFNGVSWGANGSINLYYKKVSLYMMVNYDGITYDYTQKYNKTPNSDLSLTWRLQKGWALTCGLRSFAGINDRFESWIIDKDFSSYSKVVFNDRHLQPMIGFTYFFQNKASYKWREKMYLDGEEQGLGRIKAN